MHKLGPEKREVFNASAQSPSKISASNNTAKLAIKNKTKQKKKPPPVHHIANGKCSKAQRRPDVYRPIGLARSR